MDWFFVVWVAFIILVSVISNARQEARKRGQLPPMQRQGGPPLPAPPRAQLPGGEYRTPTGEVVLPRVVVVGAPPQDGRFAGWGAWPGEESTSEEVLDEAEPEEGTAPTESAAATLEVAETDRWQAGLEEIPAGHGVVSLEQETVDWTREHERFHQRYVDAAGTPLPATHGALDVLREPNALRKAVLLAEVLGPPRALRDHDL
ncbi:MAG TPA: hypothetical protein VFX98_10535 [Longimicrobiaceae bacterium]|nr:hypothetical protein [Longimicrobiaceae bacterium]